MALVLKINSGGNPEVPDFWHCSTASGHSILFRDDGPYVCSCCDSKAEYVYYEFRVIPRDISEFGEPLDRYCWDCYIKGPFVQAAENNIAVHVFLSRQHLEAVLRVWRPEQAPNG